VAVPTVQSLVALEPPVPVVPAVPVEPAVPVAPAVPVLFEPPPQPAALTAATGISTNESRTTTAIILTNMRSLQDILDVFAARSGWDPLHGQRLL
jgi:hypothetical protein